MRRMICTILYKLGFRKAAYYVSPSIYTWLLGKDFAENFTKALEATKARCETLKEKINELEGKAC